VTAPAVGNDGRGFSERAGTDTRELDISRPCAVTLRHPCASGMSGPPRRRGRTGSSTDARIHPRHLRPRRGPGCRINPPHARPSDGIGFDREAADFRRASANSRAARQDGLRAVILHSAGADFDDGVRRAIADRRRVIELRSRDRTSLWRQPAARKSHPCGAAGSPRWTAVTSAGSSRSPSRRSESADQGGGPGRDAICPRPLTIPATWWR